MLLLILVVAPGCERGGSGSAADAARLLRQVEQGLGERDARLRTFRFEGTVQEEGEAPLPFRFAYRAPARMRGSLGGSSPCTFAYDGEHLYEQRDAERRLTTFTLALPPPERTAFLTEVFSPFLPEGFRVPLLPRTGVSAERAVHRLAPQAVRLRVALPQGEQVEYLLRWPSLDFLGKRTQAGELRVEAEACDAALHLCVPRRLTRWVDGRQVGQTELRDIALGPALPSGLFVLEAPAGYEARTQRLVPRSP
nr:MULTISPECIES: hypothetical protein [Myxococcaceae]